MLTFCCQRILLKLCPRSTCAPSSPDEIGRKGAGCPTQEPRDDYDCPLIDVWISGFIENLWSASCPCQIHYFDASGHCQWLYWFKGCGAYVSQVNVLDCIRCFSLHEGNILQRNVLKSYYFWKDIYPYISLCQLCLFLTGQTSRLTTCQYYILAVCYRHVYRCTGWLSRVTIVVAVAMGEETKWG